MKRLARALLGLVAALSIALLIGHGAASAFDFPRLEKQLIERFGPAQVPALKEWQKTQSGSINAKELDKLKRVNDFFNRVIRFEDDITIWNQTDYWATPLETVGKNLGDCEDYAIAKYFSLKDIGVPLAKLRLVYVKARLQGPAGPSLQAHMVLAYYPAPNAEPLVLDNLIPEIRPASERSDLQPMFSFNSEAIWAGVAENAKKGAGTGQLSRWQDLLQRARNEGFE